VAAREAKTISTPRSNANSPAKTRNSL